MQMDRGYGVEGESEISAALIGCCAGSPAVALTPPDFFSGAWRACNAAIALYVADLQSDWPLRMRLTVGCEVPIWAAI